MAVRYYDEALIRKLKAWIPENTSLRVLAMDESKRLIETLADDSKDTKLRLPFISLSRSDDITLRSTVKQPLSFSGVKLTNTRSSSGALIVDDPTKTSHFNALPISLNYKLDIYTKTAEEGDEYLRNFLFKLINNPVIKIDIPYNGANIQHRANIRVQDNIANTSSNELRAYAGQFTRWTIQLEILDAFLFSIPFRKNWRIEGVTLETELNSTIDKEDTTCCLV